MTPRLSALDAFVPHDVAAMRTIERHEFDRLSGGRGIVLMGAGGLGRRTLAGLRLHGVEPLAFADNAPSRQGTTIDGVRVLSPAAAAAEFGRTAAFVVTIWGANSSHRFAHSREQLQRLGCGVVCPFPPLFWKYADALLPFYLQDLPSKLVEQRAHVMSGFDLWEDDDSRAEYVAQVRFRLMADLDGLPHPVAHPQYFPDDLFEWSGDEWIVDGGAYDGDTIRTLARLRGDRFGHVLAAEPDPRNYERLRETVSALPGGTAKKVDCQQVALSAAQGVVHIESTGTAASVSSAVQRNGTIAVPAATVDALVGRASPTFIKLDIEGFEVEALQGCRGVIARDAPMLAVCVYHRQSDLWHIPLLLRRWRDDYALFLRPHNEEGWDLVCYAVPRNRLKDRR